MGEKLQVIWNSIFFFLKIQIFSDIRCYPLTHLIFKDGVNTFEVMLSQSSKGGDFRKSDDVTLWGASSRRMALINEINH